MQTGLQRNTFTADVNAEESTLLSLKMKGFSYGWTCFCSYAWSGCLNGHLGPVTGISIAYFKELCGMPPPFAAVPVQSSGSSLSQLFVAALTIKTWLLLLAEELFTSSRKGQEMLTCHNTLSVHERFQSLL